MWFKYRHFIEGRCEDTGLFTVRDLDHRETVTHQNMFAFIIEALGNLISSQYDKLFLILKDSL